MHSVILSFITKQLLMCILPVYNQIIVNVAVKVTKINKMFKKYDLPVISTLKIFIHFMHFQIFVLMPKIEKCRLFKNNLYFLLYV